MTVGAQRAIRHALVTGGAGFIGSNLVSALCDRGIAVTVLDNLHTGHRGNLNCLNVRFLHGDVRDPGVVTEAISTCDTVFHMAAAVGNARSIANPIEDAEINMIGTLHVLEAARRQHVEKLVFSSSAAIFGELKHLPIAEDHVAEPESPYGVSKLAAEKLCLAYGRLYGMDVSCLRYFNVYGLNQRYDAYGNVIPIFVRRLLQREPLIIHGDGEQTRDFVSVHDVVQANIKAAALCTAPAAFNIGSGTAVTINQVVSILERVSGMPMTTRHSPPRQGDVRQSRADVSAATRVFGYRPRVSLECGLREYFKWAEGDVA